ncbi:MAG: PEP/pyruvate-binding domain-containing protein [Candidatus Humimicrobiaceae bacterium]
MQILDLKNIPESVYSSVGGKARGLNSLDRAGLKIAPGFVIRGIENEEDIDKAVDFYLGSGLGMIAVRSSATTEDSEDFSHAGQYLSFLNVCGKDDVKIATRRCLDSLNNINAASYSNIFKQEGKAEMSVIIQKMIKAQKAGVCFTQDPIAGGNYMLIEAVQGLGEQLVSGSTSGIQYRIPVNGTFNTADSEDGLLNTKELARIRDEALLASRFMDRPLDTEWAIDNNGELFWLQARPITSIDEPDFDELDVGLDISNNVITSCNISEMLPGAVTPLSISTSVDAIDFGMRKMFVKTGVFKTMEDIPPASCVLSVSNHLFINLSTIYKMEDCVLGASSEAVDLSICGRVLDDIHQQKIKKLNILVRMNNGRKYFSLLLSKDRARRKIVKIAKDFKISIKDTPLELFSEIDNNLPVLKEAFWLHYITSGHSGAMASALFMILKRDIADNEKIRSVISSVLEDIDGIESVDILRSLRRLASAILLENPSSASATLSASSLIDLIKKADGEIKDVYDYFIERHGHRAIREAEIRSKSWKSDEEGLADYLKVVLISGAIEEIKDNSANRNISELLESYKGIKKNALKYIIGQARTGVKNRELSKSMCIKVLEQFKVAYSFLAKKLVISGLLPDEDLIYFLQHAEIRQLVMEGGPKLIKKALARRRLLPEEQLLKFKEVYIGKPVPVTIETLKAEIGTVLDGSPCSRGKATGKARVVKTIEDANKLEKGEIMVAAFTDIGWSPYYCLIGALVTEIGSVLSHGVVVAREYSLPLVANISGATQLIKTGDTVYVDGDAGKVTILKT